MGLLRLLFRLDADASGLRSKLHAAEHDMTGFARRAARDFRTGFTTFFSVSALKNLIRNAYEFAEKYASDDEFMNRVQTLGTVIEESLIKQTRTAAAEIEALGYHMKHGLLMGLQALTPGILNMSAAVMRAGAFWGAASVEIASIPEKIRAWMSEDKMKGEVGDMLGQMLSGRKPKKDRKFEMPFGEGFQEDLVQVYGQVEELIAAMKSGADKLGGQVTVKSKTGGADAEAAAAMGKRDTLASIGGFTSRADTELQSLSKRQLRELEKITKNTEALDIETR